MSRRQRRKEYRAYKHLKHKFLSQSFISLSSNVFSERKKALMSMNAEWFNRWKHPEYTKLVCLQVWKQYSKFDDQIEEMEEKRGVRV